MGYYWNLLKQFLLLTLGGLVGAIFGLFSQGAMDFNATIILILSYGIAVFGIIIFVDFVMGETKKK